MESPLGTQIQEWIIPGTWAPPINPGNPRPPKHPRTWTRRTSLPSAPLPPLPGPSKQSGNLSVRPSRCEPFFLGFLDGTPSFPRAGGSDLAFETLARNRAVPVSGLLKARLFTPPPNSWTPSGRPFRCFQYPSTPSPARSPKHWFALSAQPPGTALRTEWLRNRKSSR